MAQATARSSSGTVRAHSLANIPLGRFGNPEEDAGSLAVFLATPGAHFFTGDTFNLDGGRCLRP